MEAIRFKVNGNCVEFRIDPQAPLPWTLREQLGLTGKKFGCGMALCGTCTVHVNSNAVRSCVTPVRAVRDQQVTTIEGLSTDRSVCDCARAAKRLNLARGI